MIESNYQKLLEIARDISDLEFELDHSHDAKSREKLLIALDNLKDYTRVLYEALVVARHELTAAQVLSHESRSAAEEPPIFEPSTEKIKDIVAQMTPEPEQVDNLLERITDGSQEAQEALSHYQEDIEFEPVSKSPPSDLNSKTEKPKSVNDQWGQVSVGLNDRTAFVQHLFQGDVEGFNRVLSQINTFESFDEAQDFLTNQVQPEYRDWEGKEAVAERLMRLIQQRFNA
jgi:hypothetical protein